MQHRYRGALRDACSPCSGFCSCCRGMLCADGSFPDFFTGKNCDHLTLGGQTVMFDYFDDAAIPRTGAQLLLLRLRYRWPR